MTISSEVNRSGPYSGNGATTVFDYDFKIDDENHIQVIKTSAAGAETVLTIDADYIVSDVGNPLGGQVSVSPAPATGELITLLRAVPFLQETDLENQGAYFAEIIEAAFDRSVMRDQQLAEQVGRSLKIPASADPEQLAGLIEDVIRLADSVDNIDAVAANEANINAVAANEANINTVASIAADVSSVAGIAANIVTVAGVADEVVTVAGIAANIVTVAGVADEVVTVAGIAPQVVTVAGVADDIPIVAANVADITNFADVYQGPKAADPTTRNDGSPLQAGDLYFNTTSNVMKGFGADDEWYDSSAPALPDGGVTRPKLSDGMSAGVSVNVIEFGGNGDGIFVTGPVTTASGSASLTASATSFAPADVGKVITVPGVGPSGADLTTTIAAVINAGSITLGTTASLSATVSRELFYGTNNSAAFQAAFDATPEQGSIVIPSGNYHLLTAVSQPSKRVRWIGEPGARFNVQAAANAFNGSVTLLDYASARDTSSFEYGGTVKVGGESWKYWNWTIGPTSTPYSYQKNALAAYVLQNDPSSGLGNGDAGPNISRDGVGADIRAYIGNGNMTGRAFGLNVIAAHQGTAEGMLSGIEVDIANGASNVPDFDDNTVDFPKSGIGVVSKGPNNVTMAYHFMEGGGKFYVGYYGTWEAIVDHPESRFIKLRDMFSVYRHGHVTVGKDHADLTLQGIELDPVGTITATGSTGVGTRVALSTGAGVPALEFYVSGSKQSYINDNGGSVNVYSNGAGSQGMYIAHGASAWSTISDARLPYKKAARHLSVLDRLGDIALYENEVDGRLELFVKAQEIHKAFPHLVNVGSGPDDYEPTGMSDPKAWGVSYERAGVVALAGLKEMREIIIGLQQELADLKARVPN
ncbi:MAG TPA: hypothetical protein VIU82_21845 [Bosea sp. (in: a-proteobacteria)]